MSSPQVENGYVRIASEIFDALSAYRIPGEQMQCLLFILRKTYGYNKKTDMISNSQFCEATGLKKPSVCRAINGLVKKKLISKKANTRIPTYQFNKHYKKWKVLAKKITVSKKVNPLLAKKLPTIDNSTIDKKTKAKESSVLFLDFWKRYPRKIAKVAAVKAWDKIEFENGMYESVMSGLESAIRSEDWEKENGKYIPHPATWLNGKRWEDEYQEKQHIIVGGYEF